MYGIMAAILTMKGPICTPRIIQKNGPRWLRNTNKEQFLAASTKLEQAGLGTVVSNPTVFVKIHPNNVQKLEHVLMSYCTYEHYAMKYFHSVSICVKEDTKKELVSLGLLDEKYLAVSQTSG